MQIQDSQKPFTRSAFPLVDALRAFFKLQAAGGILLVVASALAIWLANSDFGPIYDHVLNHVYFTIGFEDHSGGGVFALSKSVLHWVNDGLMVIFFFLVGLEIKREFKSGELSSRDRAILPIVVAVGGMLVPALVYFFFNHGNPETYAGWAIPSATDIAFTLGVMSLLGPRVPLALKVFVTAVAVIDDLGAILIIALFYTDSIHVAALALAAVGIGVLALLNARGVAQTGIYIAIGFLIWIAVLQSGVHATIAGVLVALCIPSKDLSNPARNPGRDLEHALHPWVAFMILPLFGLANAGVPFAGMTLHSLLDPVVLGIALGLFVGKQVGIFGFTFAAVKLGLSPKPAECNWMQIYGAALLCGIGFTMSLFIGNLAFESVALQAEVRLGVLLGSITSACAGAFVLWYASRRMNPAALQFVKT